MTNIFSSLICSIKGAANKRQKAVEINTNKFCITVLDLLKKEGFIVDFESTAQRAKVFLKYNDKGKTVISEFMRVSSPGRRTYIKPKNLPTVVGAFGILGISTSKGLMSHTEASEKNIGGEALFKIW